MLSWQMSGTSPQPGVGDEKIWSLKQVQCTWYYLRFVKMLQLYLKQNHFPTGCSTSIFTFLKCSWASRSFFLRAVELDSSWFQRFIKAAWRASMAFDWTCWAASSWSLRAVMLVIPSCWKAWRPASNVSCRQTQTRFCKRENLTSTKERSNSVSEDGVPAWLAESAQRRGLCHSHQSSGCSLSHLNTKHSHRFSWSFLVIETNSPSSI